MSHVSYETSLRLKQSGMPQPEPEFPQMWWLIKDTLRKSTNPKRAIIFDDEDPYFVSEMGSVIYLSDVLEMVFAPTVEDIATYLPEGFILEMWDGRQSCKVETEDRTIRTFGDTFAEAAAEMWLKLNKKQPMTQKFSISNELPSLMPGVYDEETFTGEVMLPENDEDEPYILVLRRNGVECRVPPIGVSMSDWTKFEAVLIQAARDQKWMYHLKNS